MYSHFLFTALVLVGLITASPTMAQEDKSSALPVPRFVTLGTDEVNMRTGPGLRYPIRLIIRRDHLPVEIIREYDVWRQIRDSEGDEGWVHKSMLSGKRTIIVKDKIKALLKKPSENGQPVAKLEPGVIAYLDRCQDDWCKMEASSYEGWMKREDIWGVYPDEKFEE